MTPSSSYVTKTSPVSYADQATQSTSNCPSADSSSVVETLLKGVFLHGQVLDRKYLGINAEKDSEGSLDYVIICQIIQKEIIKLEGVFEALDSVSRCSSEVTVSQFLLGLWGYIPLKNTSEDLVTEAMIKICYKLSLLYNIHCGNYIQKLSERIQRHLMQNSTMEEKMDNFDDSNNIPPEDEWFWKHLAKERLPKSEKYFNSDKFTYGDMTFTNESLHFCVWYRLILIDLHNKYRLCQSTLEAVISPCQSLPVLRDLNNLKTSPESSKNSNEYLSTKFGFVGEDSNQEIRSTYMPKKPKKNKKSPREVNVKKFKTNSQPLLSCDEGIIVPNEDGLHVGATESTRNTVNGDPFTPAYATDYGAAVGNTECTRVSIHEESFPSVHATDDGAAVGNTKSTRDSINEESFPSVYGIDDWTAVGDTESTRVSGQKYNFNSVDREDIFSFDFSSVTKLKNFLDTDSSLQQELSKAERRQKAGEKKLKTMMKKTKITKYLQVETDLTPDMLSFCFPLEVVERCM